MIETKPVLQHKFKKEVAEALLSEDYLIDEVEQRREDSYSNINNYHLAPVTITAGGRINTKSFGQVKFEFEVAKRCGK